MILRKREKRNYEQDMYIKYIKCMLVLFFILICILGQIESLFRAMSPFIDNLFHIKEFTNVVLYGITLRHILNSIHRGNCNLRINWALNIYTKTFYAIGVQ